MQRRFDFRQRLIVQPGNVLTFAVVSVLLCVNGFGVWGLVIASYAGQLVWVLTSWTLAGWRPGAAGRPSVRVWRELATFSLPLVVWTVVNRARDLLETSIVGGALSATALGHYRYGRRLGSLPETAIIEVGSYVLFPAFSRIAGDPQRLRAAFLRALRVLWCLAIPVAGFFVAAGEPAVTVLLGENWRGAGVMLVALAGVGPGVALSAIGMESIKGVGRTRLLNWVTLVTTGLGSGCCSCCCRWGSPGSAWRCPSPLRGWLAQPAARPPARGRDVPRAGPPAGPAGSGGGAPGRRARPPRAPAHPLRPARLPAGHGDHAGRGRGLPRALRGRPGAVRTGRVARAVVGGAAATPPVTAHVVQNVDG